MMSRVALFILPAIVMAVGCSFGGIGQVDGVVLVNGKPTSGFEVTFTPVGGGNVIRGVATEEGKFKLIRGRGEVDIPSGDYKVTVAAVSLENSAAPRVQIPSKYTEVSEAVIVKTVAPGPNKITIELETGS